MQMQFDLELENLDLEKYNKIYSNGTKNRYYTFVKSLFDEIGIEDKELDLVTEKYDTKIIN